MIEQASWVGFTGASLAVAISPGASWMYVITHAVGDRAAGRAAIAGNAAGILGHTLLAVLGLSALIAYSATVYTVVRWLGACYLIYLAVRTVRAPSPFAGGARLSASFDSARAVFRGGVVMNLLNPKPALLMVALVPQFLSLDASSPALQIAIFGATHALIATIVLSTLAALTHRAAPILSDSPRVERAFRWFSGAVLFGFGARTALDV